jgi:hypothetical protein
VSPPGTGVTEYEAVRREATTDAGPPGLGLTLLLARGLPAWLTALTALGPPAPPRPIYAPAPAAGPPRVLPATARDLTTVLAGMVLACTRSQGGSPCPLAR